MRPYQTTALHTAASVLAVFITTLAISAGLDALLGSAGAVLAVKGLLAKVFEDPELKEMWEQEALKEGENQTEFTELEIGTTFATDGAEKSETVIAAPILFYDKLKKGSGGGRFVNIKVDKPLFTDIQDILKRWRYSSQERIGSEEEAERGAVTAVVDNIFLALKETEIKQGLQETANVTAGSLMRHLVTLLGRNTKKRQDVGVFWALAAGYDMHHYVNIGLRKALADGAVPIGESQAGVYMPPTEHPVTYVWKENNVMTKVEYDPDQATHSGNLAAELGAVTAAATPGLAWLRSIYRIAWRNNVIPAAMRWQGRDQPYYILYVPGRVRDLIEQDTDFMELYSRAYQGKVESNPLIQDDDLMYKTLIIRDSKWLEDEYFSYANSFNAVGGASAGDMSFNLTTINGVEWADVDPGARDVPVGSAFEGDAGAGSFAEIGRCFLLGANAAVRATGNDYELSRMEVTDYGNNDGVGQDKYVGHNRVDSFTNQGDFDQTIQSICFAVYQGAN